MKKAHRDSRGGTRQTSGTVKRHPDGFGFLITDNIEDPDIYIPRHEMKGVMSNDRVRVTVEREKGGDRFRGSIIEITKRAVTRAMGAYHETTPGRGVLLDKSFAWGEDLSVSCPAEIQAKSGQLVVVQVENYPESPRGFSGRVIAVIGDAADPMNDSVRMLHAHQIPYEFSKATLCECSALADEVTEKDWRGRKDLRSLPIITIDGKTAKDFDDAVFTEMTGDGFHLIVAIADVSHYVKPGSAIDEDAYERGTSTYFPNFVAPMLPEKLSNELCSLKPHVPRLAMVAEMWLNFQGDLTRSEFYEGVIRSAARVTYGQAQEVIDKNCPEELKHVEGNILRCADLARLLMAKRFREGSLDLDLPETEVELDETGMPVDILRSERLFAHRLIEELMLQANVAVARYFREHDIPSLNRIHEEPATEAIRNFDSFLRAFGYKQKMSGGHLQKKITKALEFFKGHPKEHILNMLALRSLAQAKYSPENVGHFGLGFADYVHFTSPIRRYPDLIVHRLLKGMRMSVGDLDAAGTVLSACEQRSVKAERQIKSIKKARFLGQHIGEEFEGIISSVTRFGLFVLLRQFDVDGLIRVEELGGDRFEFDEEKLRLVGRKSGMAYEIGESIQVVVARADIEAGQVDFVLPGRAAAKTGASVANEREVRDERPRFREKKGFSRAMDKAKPSFQKRGAAKDDSRGVRRSRFSKPRRAR